MHIPATDDDLRLFDYSKPTPLPDGGSWTALLRERDSWYAMTLTFDVAVQRSDGSTEAFTLVLTDPSDVSGEPAATRARLDAGVRGRLGLRG